MRTIIYRIIMIIVFGIILIWVGFLLFFGVIPPSQTNSPLSWKGITPGSTFSNEVLTILGEPFRIETRGNFTIYRYPSVDGWESVEIWMKNEALLHEKEMW